MLPSGPTNDVVGLVELAISVARHAGNADAHQLLALLVELVDLVAPGARLVSGEVGDPDVAILGNVETMRRHRVIAYCAGCPADTAGQDSVGRG